MIQPGRKEEGLCEPRQELGGGRVLDIAGREGEGGVKAESAQVSGDGKLGGAGEGSEANLDGGAWGAVGLPGADVQEEQALQEAALWDSLLEGGGWDAPGEMR